MTVTFDPGGAKVAMPSTRYSMLPHQPAITTLRAGMGSGPDPLVEDLGI